MGKAELHVPDGGEWCPLLVDEEARRCVELGDEALETSTDSGQPFGMGQEIVGKGHATLVRKRL